MTFARCFGGFAYQVYEPFKGVFSIPGLRSVPAGIDHQDSFGGEARSGAFPQAFADMFREGRGGRDVEPELYGRCDLVHILSPGARSSYKVHDDFFFRYLNALCYSNHFLTL